MFGAQGIRFFALLVLFAACVHAPQKTPVPAPRDANGKVISGVVGLEVSIDAEGKVTNVVVVSSGGRELDTAAREAVLKMKFEAPGKATTIRYSYEFAGD
jgi:TonB family protein